MIALARLSLVVRAWLANRESIALMMTLDVKRGLNLKFKSFEI